MGERLIEHAGRKLGEGTYTKPVGFVTTELYLVCFSFVQFKYICFGVKATVSCIVCVSYLQPHSTSQHPTS